MSAMTLIRTTCHLYRQSLLKILPISIFLAIVYHAIRFGLVYIPPAMHSAYLNGAMLIVVLSFPLYGAMMLLINNQAKNITMSFGQVLLTAYQKLLSFFGALISMIVLPAVTIGVILAIIFAFAKIQPVMAKNLANHFTQQFGMPHIIEIIKVSLVILVTLLLTSKIFAPFLVHTDDKDANSSLDASIALVKHYYFRTVFFFLYNVILLVILWKLPQIIELFWAKPSYPWIWEIVSSLLLAIIGPWTLVSMLVQQYDLQAKAQ